MNFPLKQIYFYVTTGCNLRCRHCWIDPDAMAKTSGPVRNLDPDLFSSIIKQADTMECHSVKLTGGEPLLHPRFEKMLELLRDRDFSINIETNGTLCTPQLADKIALFREAFVSVSLDGADAETHDWIRETPGSFDRTVSGIKALVGAGLKPQLIMTILKKNQSQIEAVIKLARSLGAGSVKLNILQPIGRGALLYKEGSVPDIGELLDIGEWIEGPALEWAGIPVSFQHPPAFRPLGKMFGEVGDGCSSCGILGILGVLAGGSYALCGIGETVPEMIFADARSTSLEEVWNQAPLLSELRRGVPARFRGICRDCLLKKQCLGACIAQNYYRSRNLWAPFWYCEEAAKIKRFPLTRLHPDSPQVKRIA